jgi:hypothetical protein
LFSGNEKRKLHEVFRENLARLILDPDLESVTGNYFVGKTQSPLSKESYDAVKAKALWERNSRLVGLPVETTVVC